MAKKNNRWTNVSPEERSKEMSRIVKIRHSRLTKKDRKELSKKLLQARYGNKDLS